MLAIEADIFWNMVIPRKNFESLIKLSFFFFFYGFPFYIKKFINGKIFVHVR